MAGLGRLDRAGRRRDIHPRGLWRHTVLTQRRWTCGTGAGAARVHRERGHGGPGDSHHARAGGRHHRRQGVSRDRAAWRGADPRPCSHIRVGTFQFFAARGDLEALRPLADHAIARHDPGAAAAAKPYRTFLEGVVARQASLVAQWLLVGFIHGVMNTDNTTIAGETIDYGPCAFMDAYDPATVFSSIDHRGRYATPISRISRPGTSRGWRKRSCRCWPTTASTPWPLPTR